MNDLVIEIANAAARVLERDAAEVLSRRRWVVTREKIWGDPERKDREVYIVREQETLDLRDDGSAYRKTIGRIVGPLGAELIWSEEPFGVLVRCDEWYKRNVENDRQE